MSVVSQICESGSLFNNKLTSTPPSTLLELSMVSSDEENEMVDIIHQKRLFDVGFPLLKKLLKNNASVQEIFKDSGPLAALQLVNLALSAENESVRRQAAKDVIEHSVGKAVERSISVHADISQKRESDIEKDIEKLLRQYGGENIKYLESPPRQVKTKTKLRKPKQHEILDAEFTEAGDAPKDEA